MVPNLSELELLIEEQKLDDLRGHRIERQPRKLSLDAVHYNTDNFRELPKFRSPISDEDSRHGTCAGYSAGCKCSRCRKAMSDRQIRRKLANRGKLKPNDPRHGTINGYNNYMCRCDRCKKANASTQKAYQDKKKKERETK